MLGSALGVLSVAGTKFGNCLTPCLWLSSGNGALYAARTSSFIPFVVPFLT